MCSIARARTLRTFDTCHSPPRAVRTPRLFNAIAMALRLVTPAFCSDDDDWPDAVSELIGRSHLNVSSCRSSLAGARWIAELRALQFARGEGALGALGDLTPLLLGQRGVEVQHEWISVRAELSHDEGHTLGHQAGNEGHVARQAIELGDKHRTLRLARCGQRCGKLWPSVERISTFAGFDLGELGEQGDAFRLGKACDGGSLGFQAEPDRPCRWVETR